MYYIYICIYVYIFIYIHIYFCLKILYIYGITVSHCVTFSLNSSWWLARQHQSKNKKRPPGPILLSLVIMHMHLRQSSPSILCKKGFSPKICTIWNHRASISVKVWWMAPNVKFDRSKRSFIFPELGVCAVGPVWPITKSESQRVTQHQIYIRHSSALLATCLSGNKSKIHPLQFHFTSLIHSNWLADWLTDWLTDSYSYSYSYSYLFMNILLLQFINDQWSMQPTHESQS